jgi:site-specific recombinase XerD
MSKITTDTRKIPSQDKAVAPVLSPKSKGSLAVVPQSTEETCPFRKLIREWLDACRASGYSPKTLTDYSDKLFKFWWWWTEYSRYAEKLGVHPENVTTREARAFVTYLREPTDIRWGITNPTNNRQRFELAPASIASYGRTVKAFFGRLEKENNIEKTPFNKSVSFSSRYKQDRVIKRVETEDLTRIFEALTRPDYEDTFLGCRNLAMMTLLLDTGSI